MLSDEEREALQYFNTETRTEEMHYGAVLVKLIEKQSKEIEELKDKCKELIFEKQELTSALLDSTPDDKIKAKIEELDYNDIGNFERRCKQEVLQSLLEEKE